LCDTAQHTLEHCEAWCEQRRALRVVAGEDLSLPVLVAKMVGSEEVWRAVIAFCEEVVLQKETAERIRHQHRRGAAAAVADSSDEEEEESEGDEGVVRTPPLQSLRPQQSGGARDSR